MAVAWTPGKSALNAKIQKAKLQLSGAADTETTEFISGTIRRLTFDVGTIAENATITLTDPEGYTLFTYTAPDSEADVTYFPSIAAHDLAMGAATALEVQIPVCGVITATLASGAAGNDPAVTIFVEV